VENNVDHLLDVLITALCKILVLLIGFTLPCPNKEGTQDFFDTVANFSLRMIADELGRCTSLSDVIHKGAGEVSRGLHPIGIQ